MVIHQGSFVISDEYTGEFVSITIHPKLIPLFKRQIRFAKLDIESLDTTIRLPAKLEKDSEDPSSFSLEKLVKEVQPDRYRLVSSPVKDLSVTVRNGKMRFFRENQALISLENIQSSLQVDKESIKTTIQCNSNRWRQVSLKSEINREDFSVGG